MRKLGIFIFTFILIMAFTSCRRCNGTEVNSDVHIDVETHADEIISPPAAAPETLDADPEWSNAWVIAQEFWRKFSENDITGALQMMSTEMQPPEMYTPGF